ncbi:hypothetical protein ACH5RR_025746 [Cinchona calisaya]|uniref:RNase H type-1 domain-containing protein n=1 Tax=Cinchona calisaya TaxID=153742 RepID=A0ABD2Z0I0_9GENT
MIIWNKKEIVKKENEELERRMKMKRRLQQKGRNEIKFEGKMKGGYQITSKAVGAWQEFKEALVKDENTHSEVSSNQFGNSHDTGYENDCIFVNKNIGSDRRNGRAGIGIVARNSKVDPIATWAINYDYCVDAIVLELFSSNKCCYKG